VGSGLQLLDGVRAAFLAISMDDARAMEVKIATHRSENFHLDYAQARDAVGWRQRSQGSFRPDRGTAYSQDRWPDRGPIETITYDLKKLTTEKIRLIRTILAEAVVTEVEKDEFSA
jgi:hypothetical protein